MEDDQLGEEDVVFLDDKWVFNAHNFCASVCSLQRVEFFHGPKTLHMDEAHQFWNTKFHQRGLKDIWKILEYYVLISVNTLIFVNMQKM